MPRRLRTAKTRRVSDLEVPESLFHYLTFRDLKAASALARPGESRWILFDIMGAHSHAEAWRAIEAEALVEWTNQHPGTRPESWWRYSAPELRRVEGRFRPIDGRYRCHASGVPYGDPDRTTPPMVESTPALLDRLNLWLPGERARVDPAAFRPQPFSWDLVESPHRLDDDEDDEPEEDDADAR